MLQKDVLEDVARWKAKSEREEGAKVTELRERLTPTRDRFMFKSGHARDKGRALVNEFRTALETRKITDDQMDAYAERLADSRDDLEDLNREMRLIPTDKFKTSDVMNENFKAIEEIQDAVRASRMESSKALSELQFGAGVRKAETAKEETGREGAATAKEIEAKIMDQYGMHPEELMAGGGWQGMKFRMKNVVGRLSNQGSLYDQWRDAKMAEEAGERTRGLKKVHETQVRPVPEARKVKEDILVEEEAARRKALEQEKVKNRENAVKVFSRERAAAIWDTVNAQLQLTKERSFNAEDYVVMAAKYQDAVNHKRKGGIADYGAAWEEMNHTLGYTNELNPATHTDLYRFAEVQGKKRAEARVAERPAPVAERPVIQEKPVVVEEQPVPPVTEEEVKTVMKRRAKPTEAEETPEIEVHGPGVEEEERPSGVRLKKGAKLMKPPSKEAAEKFEKEAAARWDAKRAEAIISKVKDDAGGTIKTIEALVTKKLREDPKRSTYLMKEMKGYPLATSLEDTYVYAVAKFLEDPSQRDHLLTLTGKLGINNAWINSILAEAVGPKRSIRAEKEASMRKAAETQRNRTRF